MRTTTKSALVVGIALAGLAAAARGDESATNAAIHHYNRGMLLVELRQYREAISEFEQGFTVMANPNFLFNIAMAHRKIGLRDASFRPGAAVEEYRDAIDIWKGYLERRPDAPDREKVEKLIEESEADIAKLHESERRREEAAKKEQAAAREREDEAQEAAEELARSEREKVQTKRLAYGLGFGGAGVANLMAGVVLLVRAGQIDTELANVGNPTEQQQIDLRKMQVEKRAYDIGGGAALGVGFLAVAVGFVWMAVFRESNVRVMWFSPTRGGAQLGVSF